MLAVDYLDTVNQKNRTMTSLLPCMVPLRFILSNWGYLIMFENGIEVYLGSNEFVGLDKLLTIQRKLDGKIASTMGLTGLSVISFILGFIVCYLIIS